MMWIVLLIIVLLLLAYTVSTIGRRGHEGYQTLCGWAYAHRGLHGPGVPENSMKAFRRAKESGFGIELDVHLLKDGNLAVIHDASLKRTTGCEGWIEDLTTEDLTGYYLEGSLETIPTFRQVLELYRGEAPLIVELKCERGNYAALCEAACRALEGYSGAYCLESFDPRCVFWLRKNRPQLVRGQLAENYFRSKTSRLPWHLKLVLSFQMLNFLTRPDFVAYRYKDRKHISNFFCRKLWHLHGVSWTLQDKQEYSIALLEGWLPIFENFIP